MYLKFGLYLHFDREISSKALIFQISVSQFFSVNIEHQLKNLHNFTVVMVQPSQALESKIDLVLNVKIQSIVYEI